MQPAPRIEIRPWPYAPRPFDDEALGSWIGRVAAHYRMGVHELLDDSGIADGPRLLPPVWLDPRQIGDEALARLAACARVSAESLSALRTPSYWTPAGDHLRYCARCLFLNEADVCSPRWKREWPCPETDRCARHVQPLERIRATTVARCANFRELMQTISRWRGARARVAR